MLLIIAAVLLFLWLGGFAFSVGGSIIHALLVLAVIVLVANFVLAPSRRGA